ncbi:MAG: hypothetical protein KJO23_07840 [Bacteroidia bacterium]|nr:hypothetical protein [Bacteroidia bacterium]NNM24179.1 hypothetical protein [Flavobacteriaceae bacterium]
MKPTLLGTILLLFMTIHSFGQKATQSYTIHVDYVKPSMTMEYEKISKELVAASKAHGLNVGWLAMVTEGFDYYYVTPIPNMAELDKNWFAPLAEKMGKEKLADLFSRMDKCYDDHVNYILSMDSELSYMPNGLTQTPQGQPFRKNTIYYIAPENYSKAEQLAKDYKTLFAQKNSAVHYRVYRSGYGTEGTYFMVAVAAKNAADYERMSAANQQLLGKEGAALNVRMMSLISDMKTITGYIREDLSYRPMK